jgi:hypothetical protein
VSVGMCAVELAALRPTLTRNEKGPTPGLRSAPSETKRTISCRGPFARPTDS